MVWQVFGWGLVALGLSPIAFGVGWPIWQEMIRPRFIPRRDIEQLADDVMAKHPDDPEAAVLCHEHYHWYHSEGFEQGRWRRVRKEVRHRLARLPKTAPGKIPRGIKKTADGEP